MLRRVAAERSRRHDRRSCRRPAVAARCSPAAVSHMPRRVSTPGILSGRPLPSGGDRESSVVPQTSGCRAGSTETAASPAPWPSSGRSPSQPSLPKGVTAPPAGSPRATRGAAPSPSCPLVPSPFLSCPDRAPRDAGHGTVPCHCPLVPSPFPTCRARAPRAPPGRVTLSHTPTHPRARGRVPRSLLVPTSQRCCPVRDRPTRRLPPLSPPPV